MRRPCSKVTLGPLAQSASPLTVCLPSAADHLCRRESRFRRGGRGGSCSARDVRQLTCKARLLDLFRTAPSVHTHLHKAQRHVGPRYSRSHSWHNKSRAGSMFALSPRHIPFTADISRWLRDLFFSAWVPAHSSKFLFALEGSLIFFFSSSPSLCRLATCGRSPVGCRSQCLQQRAT